MNGSIHHRRTRLWRWVTIVLAGLLAAALAFPIGLRLAGASDQQLWLGRVAVDVRPSVHGDLVGYIPIADWGVRVDAFTAPVTVRVEPRSLDRQEILRVASGKADVLARARAEGEDAVRDAVARALLWWIGCAVVLGALAWLALLAGTRPRRALALIPVVALALACAGSLALVVTMRSTFDAAAFRAPVYFAYGGELPQILRYAESADRLGAAYRSEVERGLREFAGVVSAVESGDAPAPPDGRAMLFSDLHANLLALPTIERFAGRDTVFAPGDFGQEGGPGEIALLADRVAAVGGRMIAVSGNHDSRALMRALARRGVLVLTERGRLQGDGRVSGPPVRRVGDLLVAGAADPFEGRTSRAGRPLGFDAVPDGDARRAAVIDRLTAWIDGLSPAPDVVLIHQSSLATAVAQRLGGRGRPLLLLAGHDHRQRIVRYGSVVVVDGGTAGAGGVFGLGREAIGIARLNFEGAAARTVDMVSVEPLGGGATARRVPLGPERCEDRRADEACVYLDD